MKSLSILTLVLAASLTCAAQEPTTIDVDTVKVINNPNYVTITRDGSSTTVTASYNDKYSERVYNYTTEVNPNDGSVTGDDASFNLDFPFLKDKSSKNGASLTVGFMKDLYIGAMIPQSEPYGFRNGWDVGFGQLVGIESRLNRHGLYFNIGLGIFDKYFRIENYARVSSDFGVVSILPVGEGVNEAKSHLNLFGFQVPVMLRQKIQNVAISVGGVVNLNTYMTGSYSYEVDNIKTKETYHSLHQKPVTIDLKAAVSFWDMIGVYVRYSPMSMFRDGYGPKFKTLYAGVMFNL
jgi:hypothetical protein